LIVILTLYVDAALEWVAEIVVMRHLCDLLQSGSSMQRKIYNQNLAVITNP